MYKNFPLFNWNYLEYGLTNSARKGDINNMAVIAAINSIAFRSWRNIAVLFDNDRNDAGIFSVRLWSMGLPVSVVIDDFFSIKNVSNVP